MNAEDIYKVIEKAVGETVPPVVEKVVNGKINRLQAAFDDHREKSVEQWGKVNSHIEQMEPVLDALKFFQTGHKFAVWMKPLVPVFIFAGVIWVAFKKLFQ